MARQDVWRPDLHADGSCVYLLDDKGEIVSIEAWARSSLVANAAFEHLCAQNPQNSYSQRRRASRRILGRGEEVMMDLGGGYSTPKNDAQERMIEEADEAEDTLGGLLITLSNAGVLSENDLKLIAGELDKVQDHIEAILIEAGALQRLVGVLPGFFGVLSLFPFSGPSFFFDFGKIRPSSRGARMNEK